MAAEAQRGRQGHLLRVVGHSLGDHRHGAVLGGLGEAGRGGHRVARHGQGAHDGLHRAGGAEHVARGALHGGDRHRSGRFRAAHEVRERLGLGGVVGRRARAVGVQVPQIGRGEAALGQSGGHGSGDGGGLRVGRGHVIGVARAAEAGDLGDGRSAAGQSAFQRLDDERAGPLAGHEPAAAGVEGQRGLFGILGAGKGRQIREAGDADGAHGLLRAAHERRVDVAVADVAQRRADAMGAGGAGGHHVQALAAHAVADGQVARGDVPDHRGNEQGVHALGALLLQGGEALLQLVDAADAGAEHHGDAIAVLVGHFQAGLGQRLVGRHDGVLHEALEATRLLLGQAVLDAVKVAHLAGDVHLVLARIEALDGRDAAAALHERLPQRLGAHTGRRHRAHAGDDDAMGAVGPPGLDALVLAHKDIPPSTQMT